MPNAPLLPNAYPRGGQVAFLCEGDAVGYEAKLLKQWADALQPGGKLVDVWPCGTGHGVRGMADALGRTVPIYVILDRDFHDDQTAAQTSEKWNRDAQDLGWSWLGVKMWQRNEIENYFLDDDVIQPLLTTAFGCSAEQVTAAIDTAVKLLVPFQSLRAAFHRARAAWEATDPTSLLAPSRPQWNSSGLEPVDPAKLQNAVKARLVKWRARVVENGEAREPWKGDRFVAEFNERLKDWSDLTSASPNWRHIWAGKEVLKLVRQQLCVLRAGWWSVDAQKQQPVAWHAMKNNRERDAHDREIERALVPEFVNRLVTLITSDPADPRRAEFDEIARILGS